MIQPILITGCARSGTSMTAGIVHYCGGFGGAMSGPTRFNKRGMFENEHIRNNEVKPYLRDNGWDPLGQDPLPEIKGMEPEPGWKERIELAIKDQGYEGGPWFYKGAKMCLMWPVWHAAFPNATWIIVRRNDDEIIQSCMNTAFMRAHNTADGWQGWVDIHKRRFQEMHDAGLYIHEVWPMNFIDGDYEKMKEIVGCVRLKWNQPAVDRFVEPTFWRSRHGESDSS